MKDTSQISRVLSDIRDLYTALCTMTRSFLDAFSIPALHDLLRDRSLVLAKIDSDEALLRRISEPGSWERYSEFGEIRSAVSTITAYDHEIAARVTHDMKAVNRELSSLSATSNAAIIYTRHRRD